MNKIKRFILKNFIKILKLIINKLDTCTIKIKYR